MKRDLEQRLKRIEALYERPGSEGERQAAARALSKLRKKMQVVRVYQKVTIREYQFEQFDRKV
jgi:predicted ArsR family transcriptional regulator